MGAHIGLPQSRHKANRPIYSNKLETISEAIDKLIAANPGKVDRAKPDDLLSAMVAVCGYKPSANPPAATPPAAKKPQAGATTGR